ncbi:MAG TPA: 2-succinyl-5-enolpyruvyl-6-hydroxy-3-cyclohexene-1-carboxylic-acid synthase [Candidatus Saccharimonadales bacterium]|nr:2-succinyl-5-enolpyruvyl-6-hydroxy-3-cyclohexene-1-carboxylic-acid synthase [Candidatus Saccharimonadales bacterium]
MTEPGQGDIALACVSVLLDELVLGGVRHMCMTPGARSTPIALAAARNRDITLHVHVDERSSSFFALGIAVASGAPVATFCTSGTAAANHYPAVVEAFMARIPLIVLTADRPPELQGVGANQTIDQQALFGKFVKWFSDSGLPDDGAWAFHHWSSLGARAMFHAVGDPPGPVHLNLPFREPLLPTGEAITTGSPFGRSTHTVTQQTPDRLPAFAREVATGHRVVVVAGRLRVPPAGLVELCDERGWPLLAEPISGLRGDATAENGGPLSAGALLAADAGFRERHHPDLVIQVGATPTSRGVQELVRSADRLLIIDPDALVADPDRRSTLTLDRNPSEVIATLRDRRTSLPPTSPSWAGDWHEADLAVRVAVDSLLDGWEGPFEGRIARDLAATIPSGGVLFAGSSMPIRDVDQYMAPRDGLRVLANRGASGIDGLVSTVFGVAAVSSPTYALLGDLTLLHDAAGLLWGARRCPGAVLVVIDNDGGGIFSLLGQSSLPREEFELLFGTPHGVDLEAVARAAGAGVRSIDRAEVFIPAIREAEASGGVQVVRVCVDRSQSAPLRAEVAGTVAAALAG